MGRRRKVRPTSPAQEPTKNDETLLALTNKLAEMEHKLQSRDEEITKIAKTQRNAEVGRQKYGQSDWQKWESGSEKGYFRSIYVDIRSMIEPTRQM